MLSENIIKHFGIRIKLMAYTGITLYGWDNEKSELTHKPNTYLYWNWLMCLIGGFAFSFLFVIQIYIKVSNAEEELVDNMSFATLVLTWGELILILVICLLATRIKSTQREIMFCINQMFKYHKQKSDWLEEKGILLDLDHQKRIKSGEYIVIFSGYFSYIFPFCMYPCVFHPLEPIHNMIYEWFEFDISLDTISWIHFLLFVGTVVAMHGAANTIVVLTTLVTCYYLIATAAVQDMTPVEVTRKRRSRRRTFNTQFYGELEDDEIIIKYRVQQLFNEMINEILATWKVALHHTACLGTSVIVAYFAIKFQNVLEETGFVGYFIVGGSFCAPMAIQYFEATMLGALLDISEGFKDRSDKLVGRASLMKVFSRSCYSFYVKEAYPYFTIDKNTFLDFVSQVVDKTITLLLW